MYILDRELYFTNLNPIDGVGKGNRDDENGHPQNFNIYKSFDGILSIVVEIFIFRL